MKSIIDATRPYDLDAVFEGHVLYYLCSSPRFYGLIGVYIDPSALGSDAAKLAARCCRLIYTDTGHGPSGRSLVLQRAFRLMDDGKVKHETIGALHDVLDAAEDVGQVPDLDDVVAEFAPVLQDRARERAANLAVDDRGKGGDMSRVAEAIERADQIGRSDCDLGVQLCGAFDEIAAAACRVEDALGTSCVDIDARVPGSTRGELGVLMAESGGGKSIGLGHLSVYGLSQQLSVAYATLELPRATVLARMFAAITDIEISAILEDPAARAEAERLVQGMSLGTLAVKDFTAGVTTVRDVFDWVDRLGAHAGKPVDFLAVDYGDLLSPGKDMSLHEAGERVFKALWLGVGARNMFGWTAAQSQGRDTAGRNQKKRLLDMCDMAGSIGKVRVVDRVFTLNIREPEDGIGDPSLELFVAKDRHNKSRYSVGPFTTEFAYGRIGPSTLGREFGTALIGNVWAGKDDPYVGI